MNATLLGKDVWLRRIQRNGNDSVSYHRVFDIDLFMSVRESEARSEREKSTQASTPTDVISVERVSEPARVKERA